MHSQTRMCGVFTWPGLKCRHRSASLAGSASWQDQNNLDTTHFSWHNALILTQPSGQSDVEKMLNHRVEKTLKNSCICKRNRRRNINFISTYNFNVEKMLNHSVAKRLKNSCICKRNRRWNINVISTYIFNVDFNTNLDHYSTSV